MEVDTNELLHRIGAVLRGISDKMDRLIEIGERVEGEVRLPSKEEAQTFANAKEPAKEPEPEHPAGPKPDPGQGYRILSKDPPEDLQEGDEFWFQGKWYRSAWSDAYIKDQEKNLWYRRKIEQPKDQYRQPVLPADVGKECQFSDDGIEWRSGWLNGWVPGRNWVTFHNNSWKHARIKKDA